MNNTDKEKKLNDEFTTLALHFIADFYMVFNGDYAYTRVAMPVFLEEESSSFIDKSIDYLNWQNRETLVKSYHKVKDFIKDNPEFEKKLDFDNQYHSMFLEHCEIDN